MSSTHSALLHFVRHRLTPAAETMGTCRRRARSALTASHSAGETLLRLGYLKALSKCSRHVYDTTQPQPCFAPAPLAPLAP